MEEDCDSWLNKPNLYMTYDQHHEDLRHAAKYRSSFSTTQKTFHWDKYGSQKTGESVDSGLSAYKKSKI